MHRQQHRRLGRRSRNLLKECVAIWFTRQRRVHGGDAKIKPPIHRAGVQPIPGAGQGVAIDGIERLGIIELIVGLVLLGPDQHHGIRGRLIA